MPVPTMRQGLHGIREETPSNLWLDVGTLYKNIDVDSLRDSGSSQLEDALMGATKLGATRGGAEFTLGKTIREIDVDGKRAPTKGFIRVQSYAPSLTVQLLEVSQSNIEDAMAPMNVETHTAYNEITPSVDIAIDDYFDNVCLVTTISGRGNPVIVVLENCFAMENNDIKVEDNNEMVFEVKFMAFAEPSDPHTIPVHIFYPVDTYIS